MFTTFTALALAGGALRLVLQWQLRKRWDISLAVPQVLADPYGPGWLAEHPAAFPLSSSAKPNTWVAVA